MGGRVVGAFAVGFAVGGLCLGVALWRTGRLRPEGPPAVTFPSPGLPDMSGARQSAQRKIDLPPVPEPDRAQAQGQGEADRAATGLHLAMPLDGVDPNTITDTFHDKRDGHQHEALDIPAARGTPVHAVAEGNVAKLFTSKLGGLTVYQFDDSGAWCFYYAHLDRYAKGLQDGALLRKGDVLGYVGATGDASPDAPHLHFAVFKLGPEKVWSKGTAVDPLPLLK